MRFTISAIILSIAIPAFGQPRDTGIVLNIDVGYNTAYRNATWVPVDVLIENNQRDFDGWAEVRVFDVGDVLQSPTYRIAADCPQNSKKRFRLYVWIDNAARIEAVLYENDRLAVDAPAYIEPKPIAAEDLLAIVVDEDPMNYQFLYESLRKVDGTRRLSREDLNAANLGQLPDHLAAYEALDFIILGDVDLTRVPVAQRKLLLDYVELGGTLVTFTGVQAQSVRDSWLASHLGVEIQSLTTQPEALYRAAVFGDPAPNDFDDTRICTTATFSPVDPAVRTFGSDTLLAARRDYGNGCFITFAIDAASHALQDDPRYAGLWHTILGSIQTETRMLNTETMGVTFVNNLPQVSGVTIRPVSDVIIYLGLYIGVGIVLNWLFWSRVGRREYAWLTLLIVSFSFTAYAIVSGTSGIAGRQSRHKVALMHLDERSTLGWEHAMTGILSARVTEVNETLEGDVLVREAGLASSAGRWGITQSTFQRPFHFIASPQPAIQNLRIGANEVRGYSTTGYKRLEGTITGVVDEVEGSLTASIQNDSGLPIESGMLYLHGQFYALERDGNAFRFTHNPAQHSNQMQAFNDATYSGYWPSGFYSSDWESLISHLMISPMIDEVTSTLDPYLGPYFIGRLTETELDAPKNQRNYNTTIILAEIGYNAEQQESYPLPHRFGEYSRYSFPRPALTNWQATLASTPLDLYLRVPDQLHDDTNSRIELVLTINGPDAGDAILTGVSERAQELRLISSTNTDSNPSRIQIEKRYRIDDWEKHIHPVSGDVHLKVNYRENTSADPIQIHVNGKIVVEPSTVNDEEWPGWQ